ncbi:MAG: 30S ribosomal protein S6 [Kiritimatiellia bacterium]|jgi:small subunit ribosomal protein S6
MLRKYEALFIFSGSIKEEALDNVIATATTEIEKLGGTIQEIENLGRKTFARPLQKSKAEHGTYVKVRFSLDGQEVATLRQRFKHNDDCLRLQITTRNERIEAAKAADDERRARFKAATEAAAEAAAQAAGEATRAALAADEDDEDEEDIDDDEI